MFYSKNSLCGSWYVVRNRDPGFDSALRRNSGATDGARELRPLNAPIPIEVEVDERGYPCVVRRRGWRRPRAVAQVQDRWRIDDEWWRARPISRLYHALLLEDGTLLTVYRNLLTDAWFEQRDRTAISG